MQVPEAVALPHREVEVEDGAVEAVAAAVDLERAPEEVAPAAEVDIRTAEELRTPDLGWSNKQMHNSSHICPRRRCQVNVLETNSNFIRTHVGQRPSI